MISNGMRADMMVLSSHLWTVLRRAAAYAVDNGDDFVKPEHLHRALHDDDAVDPLLSQITESIGREQEKVPQIVLTRSWPPEQLHDPDSERAPFPIYRSLFISSPDGKNGKWLDQDSYDLFLKGARSVRAGAYLPKHLAKVL